MHKRAVYGLLLVASFLLNPARASEPQAIRIAYVGASYWSAGGGLSVVFPEMLRARGWSVDNEGLIGSLSKLTINYQDETEIPKQVLRMQQNAARIIDDPEPIDTVYIMGHSSNPFDPDVDLAARIKQLVERIRQRHPDTRIVLVSTWARPDATDEWTTVHDLYAQVGAQLHLPVISLAGLWHEIQQQPDAPCLYRTIENDGLNHHNSYAGTYANACLLYAYQTGERFSSSADNFVPTKFHPLKIKPHERPWELSPEEKTRLENAAWHYYQQHPIPAQ